jgi:hypothetical protein
MYNRTVPELRITLPTVFFMSVVPYLSLNPQICVDYYFKCVRLRFNEDAANKIAACLTTFLEQHPIEWRVCSWKNDFITEIALGELNCPGDRKKAAEHWLKRATGNPPRSQSDHNASFGGASGRALPRRIAAASRSAGNWLESRNRRATRPARAK